MTRNRRIFSGNPRNQILTTRFTVEYQHAGDAEKLARAEGWKPGDSLYDFIDPAADALRNSFHPDFDSAVAAAKAVIAAGDDVHGLVRVDQDEWVEVGHDDLGNEVHGCPGYETVAAWNVYDDGIEKLEDY